MRQAKRMPQVGKNNLTPEQREAYNDYKQTEALRIGVESVMGISGIGTAVTVVGDPVIETVLGDRDVDGQYRKMAQLNEQMKNSRRRWNSSRSTATVRAIRPRRLNRISSAVPTASP